MKRGELLTGLYGWSHDNSRILYFRYRMDPVPGTYKRSRYCYFRRPKTTQEARWSFADKEYVRSARNKRNLPNGWDDIPRKDWNHKCWKRQRKVRKQWMKNKMWGINSVAECFPDVEEVVGSNPTWPTT